MNLTEDQLQTLRSQIESVIVMHLFDDVKELKDGLEKLFQDPAFVNQSSDQIPAVYDYAIEYSIRPKRTSIDIALKFGKDAPFFYFPVLVNHE